MSTALRRLSTTLHALDFDASLASLSARRSVHSQIYLAQEMGLDAGYRFGWTPQGPYSSDLAGDLYSLLTGPTSILPFALNEATRALATKVVRVLIPPASVRLDRGQWSTLLASVHFLTRYSGLSESEIKLRIAAIDKGLDRFRQDAERALRAA